MVPALDRLARIPWPIACCASSGTSSFSSALARSCSGAVVGADEDPSEFGPGIGGVHIDNAHCLDSRFRRLDPEQGRGLAALDAAPEFSFGGDNEVLVKRIGMRGDLHPFAAAGNH